MVEYIVEVDQSETEPNLYDVEIEDTFNPFGNRAVVYVKDQNGERYDAYERGTRVDISYRDFGTSDTPTHRFTGFVVEPREYTEGGADVLEIECYTFDQFLRGTKVSFDTTGMEISAALEKMITEDTPISWNANKVEVGDPQTLTRNYRGETVESTIIELSFKSVNEEFGVDDSLEFYFRDRETTRSPRGIDDTQWTHHDIPEEGKEAVNEVTIYFNGGDESVTVDKGDDKLDTQESLGLESPPEKTLEKTFEDITDIDDARDKGEQILEERSAAQTGEVTTYGLEGARPGDLIDITIDSRGIDDEFVIAGLKYNHGDDETTVTIIRKTGYQDDVLIRIGETVEKVEMRPANRDAIENRVTNTDVGSITHVDGTISVSQTARSRFVNTGRNKARDAWRSSAPIDVAEIAVGTDNGELSRTNTSLQNEIARYTADTSAEGSDTVSYSAEVSEDGIYEIGLIDSDGDLIVRSVYDEPYEEYSYGTLTVGSTGTYTVQSGESESYAEVLNAGEVMNAGEIYSGGSEQATAEITLTVENDDTSRSVITNSGIESIRDTLANNTPEVPAEYGYGSDGTAPAVSDTALGNELIRLPLDEILVESATGSDEWSGILEEIDETTPLAVENGYLKLLQVCWPFEAENADREASLIFDPSNPEDYSGGSGLQLGRVNEDYCEFDFTPQYTIPAGDLEVRPRNDVNDLDVPQSRWYILDSSGERILESNETSMGISGLNWNNVSTHWGWQAPSLNANEQYTIGFEITGDSAPSYLFDMVAIVDSRFTSDLTFDDAVHEPNGYLDGPEMYPPTISHALKSATTRRSISEARIETSWNDTSNGQYISISPDGQSYDQFNNTNSVTTTFADSTTEVWVEFGLSRYPMGSNPQSATPRYGYNGQEIDFYELYADILAVNPTDVGALDVQAVAAPGDLSGNTIREGGVYGDAGNLLTHSIMAEFDVTEDMRVISSETIRWDNP